MNNLVPLSDLATRIKAEHQAVTMALWDSLQHALRAGDLLTEAKRQIGHGGWNKWLDEHCGVSQRSARAYMQLAKNRPEIEAKRQTSADLSINGALKPLAKPKAPPASEPAPAQVTKVVRPHNGQTLSLDDCSDTVKRQIADAIGAGAAPEPLDAVTEHAKLMGYSSVTELFDHAVGILHEMAECSEFEIDPISEKSPEEIKEIRVVEFLPR